MTKKIKIISNIKHFNRQVAKDREGWRDHSGVEYWMFFQRPQVQFSAQKWRLTTICNVSPVDSDSFF